MSAAFRVERADYAACRADLARVREIVFVQEQGVPREIEQDALDPDCHHVIARDAHGNAIGTGRLTPRHTLGRLAVLREWRGHGVGDALLQALVAYARELGWRDLSLHSQASAIGFYLRHGFLPQGAPFVEAGIDHLTLSRRLDGGAMAVTTREQARAAVIALASGARRTVEFHTRVLDPGLLDTPEVLTALRRLATRGGELRLLVHDPDTPQRALSPLIPLGQRLSTAFQFRAIEDPVDLAYPSAFAVNDRGGWYFRTLGDRVDGEMQPEAGARARELRIAFTQVWERSRPCTEYRALGI